MTTKKPKSRYPGYATFSQNRTYRYSLTRILIKGNEHYINFVLLNPSTADEDIDDPTIRRCINFAEQWGFSEMVVTNLFAIRATDPKDMKRAPMPIGPQNDGFLKRISLGAAKTVLAWGNHGAFQNRDREVLAVLDRPLFCLGRTQTGQPKHPLYLPKTSQLIEWGPTR